MNDTVMPMQFHDLATFPQAQALESRARETVARLSGGMAWPTVALFLGVLAGLAFIAALIVSGRLSYWVAVPVNALLIYFIFTPLHESVHGNIVNGREGLRWV